MLLEAILLECHYILSALLLAWAIIIKMERNEWGGYRSYMGRDEDDGID